MLNCLAAQKGTQFCFTGNSAQIKEYVCRINSHRTVTELPAFDGKKSFEILPAATVNT